MAKNFEGDDSSMDFSDTLETSEIPSIPAVSRLLKNDIFIIVGVFIVSLILSLLLLIHEFNNARESRRLQAENLAVVYASDIERLCGHTFQLNSTIAELVLFDDDVSQKFNEIAKVLLPDYSLADCVQLAPNGIVSQVYPLQGNESVIGHNLFEDASRSAEAFFTMKSGVMSIGGPYDLRQGGEGIIARYPVFLDENKTDFWGFVNIVVKISDLISSIDFSAIENDGFYYSLNKLNEDGSRYYVYGKEFSSLKNPVAIKQILFPNSRWEISIAPKTFMSYSSTPDESINNTPISFSAGSQAITRSSTSNDISKLQGQFVVFGVKSGSTAGSNMQKVFTNYRMWNSTVGAAANTTNAQGWEYVGTENTEGLGIGSIKLIQDQTIKYWDTSAADYRFVAGSPVESFSFTVDENNNVTHTTVTGIDAHIKANSTATEGEALSHDAIYVADPIIVTSANYGQPVKFQFTGQQALVRVGLYETIPGYSVTTINFYAYKENGSGWEETPGRNIVLNSLTDDDYFIGGKGMTATLTYDWSTPTPSYSFVYNTSGDVTSRNWYAGAFNAGVPSTTSSATAIDKLYGVDKDMAKNTGYFPVLPTATATESTALVIRCDYTLTSTDTSGETIEVKGATAAIPAAFARWEKNHAYTYLFKISDKTHGSAGTLTPIVFDAAIISGADNRDGFITTVSVPSITSYQAESPYTTVDDDVVTGTGVKYAPNKDIIVTVQDNSTGDLNPLLSLNDANPEVGMIKVYYLGTTEVTESDLQLTRPTVHANVTLTTTLPGTSFDFHGKEIAAGKYMKFQGTTGGYYAVEYVNTVSPVSYAYKVIKVENE